MLLLLSSWVDEELLKNRKLPLVHFLIRNCVGQGEKMKKIDKTEMGANLIIGVIIILIMIMVAFISYMEENYNVTKYLFIFDIIVLITTPVYYLLYKNIEKRKTKKIEDNIIIKNIEFEYYRDIIKEYSPATLSFILDGIEIDKDISASIIYLIKEGYLELGEGNKIEKTKKNCSKIPRDLQILCNSNINHLLLAEKINIKKEEEKKQAQIAGETRTKWLSMVEKQAKDAGLVKERKKFRMTSILTILCIIEAVYCFFVESFGLLIFSCILAFILAYIKFITFENNKWIKTQKGYEIYQKIIGLRNYIKDYSMLSEKEIKEVVLWDDYLIYAIIFNDTSKLNEEAMQFYKKVCDCM